MVMVDTIVTVITVVMSQNVRVFWTTGVLS
jgi:hypothetical protein